LAIFKIALSSDTGTHPQLMIVPLILAVRPKQWTKNLLLFAGVVFSGHIREWPRVLDAFWAFLIFCGLSGTVYLVNDLKDAENDRGHPLKRNRPIASGKLPVPAAIWAAVLMGAASILAGFLLNRDFGVLALIYLLVMIAYSIVLKHLVILDLLIVAMGFVARAVAGVWAIQNPGEPPIRITSWFITCILFLALFIVLCKRRHELILLSHAARQHRPVLEHYSPVFLDQMVNVATTATVMSYALYVTTGIQEKQKEAMIYTLPFVLYGVFRYLYLVYKRDEGGAPETLLFKDVPLLICVLLWSISVVLIWNFGQAGIG